MATLGSPVLPPPPNGGGCPGCPFDVSTCGKNIELVGVDKAQSQIVQGKLYNFKLRLTHNEDDCEEEVQKVCDNVQVLEKLPHECPNYELCYEIFRQEDIMCSREYCIDYC